MDKNWYWNSNFGPSEGAKIQKSSKGGIFGPQGRLNNFEGQYSSGIYWGMIKILKGGSKKRANQLAMALGPLRPPFLNT